jgi:transcriptional regulator with XRE-family HTH domain
MIILDSKSIGNNLRLLREQKGITQFELASRAHVSQSHISDIERNRKNPTIKVLDKLVKALDCSITDICNLKP